jgi:ATP-binding protein involved in chromosome partitioning
MMWSLPTNVPVEVSDDRTLSLPFLKHGVKISTLATRVTISQSVQWRGAMASMALINLLCHTAWGELDVLVVDMPPGTGDIQVSICQKLPNAAVVTVTTPQQVAVADTRRGMSMYRDQKLRLLGVVENMSTHICENCGHHNSIFGTQGAEQLCSEFGVPLLAQLPLDSAVRFQADAGAPLVIQCPEHPVSQIYNTISTTVWRSLNE